VLREHGFGVMVIFFNKNPLLYENLFYYFFGRKRYRILNRYKKVFRVFGKNYKWMFRVYVCFRETF
jgi:hypothetical protein